MASVAATCVGRAGELRGRALEEDRLDAELALEVVRFLGDVVLP